MRANKSIYYFLILFLIISPIALFAENDKYIDSLQKELEQEITNTKDTPNPAPQNTTVAQTTTVQAPQPYDYSQKEPGKDIATPPKTEDEKDGNVLGKLFNSMEVKKNASIQFFINYYSGFGKSKLEEALSRMTIDYPILEKYAQKYNLPAEVMLIGILESSYTPSASNPNGGKGLWQIKPMTARIYNLSMTDYLDERMDLEKSTDAAFNYMASLRDSFHGNWDLVLAAYNGGGAYINEKIRKYKTDDFWTLISQDSDFDNDTLEFVPRFYAILTLIKNASHYNLRIPSVLDKRTYLDSLVVQKSGVSFKDISKNTNIDLKTLIQLNPQLYREFTVNNANLYIPAKTSRLVTSRIKIARVTTLRWYPQGSDVSLGNYVIAYAKKSPKKNYIVYYSVKKKDTLYSIAHHYNVAVNDIKKLNHLSGKSLTTGKVLKIAKNTPPPTLKNKRVLAYNSSHHHKTTTNYKVAQSYYTVKKGDTLYSISKKYNVAIDKIKSNKMIHPGDKVRIEA